MIRTLRAARDRIGRDLHRRRRRRAARARGRRGASRVGSYLVDRRRDRAPLPAPTRCTRATASCRRTPALARACAEAGIVFVGPSPEAIELMGDKVRAKEAAARAGVPVVESLSVDEARVSDAYPLLVKAAAGGGGRGMRVVRVRRRARRGDRRRPARGGGRLRRRPRVHRALPAAGAAHRGAGDRRRARQRVLARRARVLAAAPPPEGARGVAVAGRRRRSCARVLGRRGDRAGHAPRATTARARSSSSPTPTIRRRTSSWR